jgi:nicotinamidase-related amidase
MDDPFEDHCWSDVFSKQELARYARYRREVYVGPEPAVLAIDLYELVYLGGPLPIDEAVVQCPNSCGQYAWDAIAPTERLLAAARRAKLPVFYSTQDTSSAERPNSVWATKKRTSRTDPALFAIRPEFAPRPEDVVVAKQRASVFFGTSLVPQLVQLGIRTLVICGETTSGCVRATALDAHSYGFHVVIAEECCFDRNLLSHKVNLFDLHHKYADVMKVADIVAHLEMNDAHKGLQHEA